MNGIYVTPRALPSDLCDSIVAAFEDDHRKVESHVFASTNADIRRGNVVVMDATPHWIALRDALYESIGPALDEAASRNPGLFAMLEQPYIFTTPRVERISPGGGFQWHVDTIQQDARFLTVLCYLNDVLAGGQTEFLNQDLSIQPTAGSAALFAPFWTHVHRGLPPLNQDKYTAAFFVARAEKATSPV